MKRVAVALALAAGGCGGAASMPTTAPAVPTGAVLVLSVSPSPVPIEETGDPDRPLAARWTVRIQEDGGGSGNVNFLNATLRDAATGAEAEPSGIVSLSAADIAARAGSNHLGPRGRLEVPQEIAYDLPSGGRQASLIVTIQFQDDAGRLFSQSVRASVE